MARRLWRPIAAYFLIIAALQLLITSPIIALMLDRLLRSSGERAVANFDIAWFLLSPLGMVFLLVLAGTGLLLALLAIGGLMQLGELAMQDRQRLLSAVFARLRDRIGGLLGLTAIGIGTLIVILLPTLLLLLWIKTGLLADHDINYYLSTSPPAFKLAIGLGLLVVLPALLLLIAQLSVLFFALPFLLFDAQSSPAAIRSSRELLLGRKRLVVTMILRLLLVVLLLSVLVHGGIYLGSELMIALTSFSQPLLLLMLGLSLAASLLASVLILYLAECALAFGILLLWRGFRGQQTTLPAAGEDAQEPRLKLEFVLSFAGIVGVLVIAWLLFNSIQLEDRVLNVAHRGSSIAAPENLLSAVKQASADGADAAEIDVQRAADGVIVVAHDRDMMRIAGQPLVINATASAELRRLDVGGRVDQAFAGEPIPTLDEVVSYAKSAGLELVIELKSYDDDGERLAREVIGLLQRHGVADRAIVMSLNYSEIRYFKQHYPEVRAGYLASAAIGDLTRLNADFLAVSQGVLSDAMITTLHGAGKKVCVWTIDDKPTMSSLIDRGVDCLITNYPGRLTELLAERRELSNVERLLLRYRQLFAG